MNKYQKVLIFVFELFTCTLVSYKVTMIMYMWCVNKMQAPILIILPFLVGDQTDTLFRVIETGTMAGQVFLTGTVNFSAESYSINIRVCVNSHHCTLCSNGKLLRM